MGTPATRILWEMQKNMPEYQNYLIPENSQVKEYQDLLFRALKAVHSYNGTEQSYDHVTNELKTFEEKIKSLNLVPEGSIQDQEARAVELFLRRDHGTEPLNISTLLDIAAESVRRTIRLSTTDRGQEIQAEQPLFVRRLSGVILPPALEPRPQPGEGVFELARFEERLLELTQLLRRNNVFLDDLIVSIGTLSPTQMREASYAVVEIPRINRTVLVCNKVGEATFVVYGLGDPRRFLALTKEALLSDPQFNVRRVIRRDPEYWHSELGALLFTEEAWQDQPRGQPARPAPSPRTVERRPQIDVRRFADVRDAVLASAYSTPESWVGIMWQQAKVFKLASLGGIGLKSMARVLGVEGNPVSNRLPRLECGRKIFGDVPVFLEAIQKNQERKESLKEITPEKIKQAVLASKYNTPESWVEMTERQALVFKLASLSGIGLIAAAGVLGVEGDPINSRIFRLECGRKIFGDVPILLEEIQKEQENRVLLKERSGVLEHITPDHVKEAVLESEYNTPESWVEMTWKQVKVFKLASLGGIGLFAVARVLGVEGDPANNRLSRFECARKIFGDAPVLLEEIKKNQERKEALKEPEKIKQAVLASKYNTPESWAGMTSEQAKAFKLASLGGIGLKSMARVLGVEGDPVNYRIPRLECARKIFGDVPVLLKEIQKEQENRVLLKERSGVLEHITPDHVKEAVLASEYSTPESWAGMKNKHAKGFKPASLGGIGLIAVARVLGVEGNPVDGRLPRLECARKIFGDVPILLEEIGKIRNHNKRNPSVGLE